MQVFRKVFLFLSVVPIFSFAMEENQETANLRRSDNIPEGSIDCAIDPYFEGYIQALVDMHFYEYQVVVLVKDHDVMLAKLPKNQLIANSIISFVKDVPGVKQVRILDGVPNKEMVERAKYVTRPRLKGIWFPQTTELFLPLIANPRQVMYSIGYRGGDRVVGRRAIEVALGDDFPVFRWLDVFGGNGDLQIGIEAGIWSVFNIHVGKNNINGGTELFNTDYYVGIPLTYAINKWAFRLRCYHISSHLGDEYMVNHPHVERKNPSFEAFDLFCSYQATDVFRFYGGPGWIMHSDNSFPMKWAYVEYGAEARFFGKKIYYHKLYGTWVAAVHMRNWERLHWNFDATGVLGYEWSKLQGVGRKIRFLLGGHDGYSLEGQFFRKRTSYWVFKFSYGF